MTECSFCKKNDKFLYDCNVNCGKVACYECLRLKYTLRGCEMCFMKKCVTCYETDCIMELTICYKCNNFVHFDSIEDCSIKCSTCFQFFCDNCCDNYFTKTETCDKLNCNDCIDKNICKACENCDNFITLCANENFSEAIKLPFHKKWIKHEDGDSVLLYLEEVRKYTINIIDQQSKYIKSLETMIEYMPDGPGYIKAKEDFESRFPLESKN